ncbi:MAG: hypothetical protein ACE5Q6_08725 [Dehalococcoidia bacterium]
MTTQTDQELLDRITRFDKSVRQAVVEPGTTVIFYSMERGGWTIDGDVSPGETITISPTQIPVAASKGEVSQILDRIPAPVEAAANLPQIRELVDQAMNRLASDTQENRDATLWRLVEAAGLLSHLANPHAQGQPGVPTGAGYQLSMSPGGHVRRA